MSSILLIEDNKLIVQDSLQWDRNLEKEFEIVVNSLLALNKSVTIDLTRCSYINSSYVSLLIFFHYASMIRNVQLRILINPKQERQFQLFNGDPFPCLEIVESTTSIQK